MTETMNVHEMSFEICQVFNCPQCPLWHCCLDVEHNEDLVTETYKKFCKPIPDEEIDILLRS